MSHKSDATIVKRLLEDPELGLSLHDTERLKSITMINRRTRKETRSDGKICLVPIACPTPLGEEIAKDCYLSLYIPKFIRRLFGPKYKKKR